MGIEKFFDNVSSIMTVVSFITFIGILWWTFITRSKHDFDSAAQLPFADDAADAEAKANAITGKHAAEARHV